MKLGHTPSLIEVPLQTPYMGGVKDHILLKTAREEQQFWQLGNTQAAQFVTVKGPQNTGVFLAADKIQNQSVFSALLQKYTHKSISKFFLCSRNKSMQM